MAKRVLRVHDNTVESLNRALVSIQQQLEDLQQRPSFMGDINMNGRRITNVGRSQKQNDVTPRIELEDRALFENAQGQHVAKSTLIAPGGIRSKRIARENDEYVTLAQVRKMTTAPTGAVLTTGDQAIVGSKSFDRIAFPRQQLNLVNGMNRNVLLGDNAKTMIQIAGPTAAFQIDGIADSSTASGWAPLDGRLMILVNVTGQPMTIVDASTSLASARNQIHTNASGNANYVTVGSGVVMLLRVQVFNSWYVIGTVS